MMKYIKCINIICSIACFGLNQNLWGERHTQMTLFFREYPEFILETAGTPRNKPKYANPDFLSRQKIKALINPNLVNGIFATYAGFLSTSNSDGQIAFPIRHAQPMIYLIITTGVTPVTMNSTTIAYWELEPNHPVEVYKMERTKDSATGLFYWNVTQEPIPTDKKVPLTSILVFANPSSIVVPIGITVTENTPNLHLPDIYVKPEINKLSNALYVLYLKHFFGPVKRPFKREEKDNASNLTH